MTESINVPTELFNAVLNDLSSLRSHREYEALHELDLRIHEFDQCRYAALRPSLVASEENGCYATFERWWRLTGQFHPTNEMETLARDTWTAAIADFRAALDAAPRSPQVAPGVQEAWDAWNANKIDASECICLIANALQLKLQSKSPSHTVPQFTDEDVAKATALAHGAPPSSTEPFNRRFPTALGLHPDTTDLVRRFAAALAEKLNAAELKYGYDNGWMDPDWQDECRAKLLHHLAKGDPRDVANYCAFMWHHGWATSAPSATRRSFNDGLRHAIMLCEGEQVDYESTKHPSDLSYNTAIKHCVERINIELSAPTDEGDKSRG